MSSAHAVASGRVTAYGTRPRPARHYRHTHRYVPVPRGPFPSPAASQTWRRCAACGAHTLPGVDPEPRLPWWFEVLVFVHARWRLALAAPVPAPRLPDLPQLVRRGRRQLASCRRSALLAVDAWGGWRSAPRAMSIRNADGETIDLIRVRRAGRPGFVSLTPGRTYERFYPTITGASGLTRYWVGGGASTAWNATGNTNWSATDGGANNASVPDSGDDVIMKSAANCGMTAGSVCRSINQTGWTGSSSGSGSLTVGDASGGAVTLGGTQGGTWTMTFASTSNNGGTGWSVTSNGKQFPGAVTFNGVGGKWVLQDAIVAGSASTFTVTNGGFFGNGKTITCGMFNSNNSNTRTVDITNCAVNISNNWTFASGGLTFTSTGSTITQTGGLFTGGALSYASVVMTGTSHTISFVNTFVNLTRTGTATKTDALLLSNNQTVTGTLTLGGNTTAGVNRLLVNSSTRGTQQTITCTGATVVISGDVDFMDIGIAGSPTWSPTGSPYVGDAGGNSSYITTNRTTPATQTHTASAGGNWSDATKWISRVPLPQDNVIVNVNTTGTLTTDMPRLGADIDFTGFAATWATSAITETYGSFTLASGMSITGSSGITFAGRSSHTLTCATKTFPGQVSFSGPTGTYTLQDAYAAAATVATLLQDGTLTTGGNTMTSGTLGSNSGRSTTFNMGASVISLTSTAATTVWFAGASMTVNASTSVMQITTISTNARTFQGNGKTYNSLVYTVGIWSGQLIISGSNTWTGTPPLNIGPGRAVTFPSSATQTFSNAQPTLTGTANGFLYLPGLVGVYASAPHSVALAITGDIDLRVRVALDDWTPAVLGAFLTKWNVAGSQSYWFGVNTNGTLQLYISTNGTDAPSATSSVATGFTDGVVQWVRVTRRQSDGRVQFFTASGALTNPVAADFTQLGTDQTSSSGSAIFSTASADVEVGAQGFGAQGRLPGNFYRAQIRNGLDGTLVFDPDLTRSLASSGWLDAAKTQFAESSSNAATVTINNVLGQVGDGRVLINSSTAGTAATLAKSFAAAVSVDYVSIRDSTATGGTWVDGPRFANVSGNTGWNFGILVTLGLATSTNTAQPITYSRAVDVGLAVSTNTAQPTTFTLALDVGQAQETGLAEPTTTAKTIPAGQAQETDTGQPTTTSKTLNLTQAAETEQADPVALSKNLAVGQAEETDTGQPATPAKALDLGQASEADTNTPATFAKTLDALGLCQETDIAQADAGTKLLTTGAAEETDTTNPATLAKTISAGVAIETDSATATSLAKTTSIGQPSETDSGRPSATSKAYDLGQAAETDETNAVALLKLIALAQTATTDTATTTTIGKLLDVSLASELDASTPLTISTIIPILVALAAETDTVAPVTAAKTLLLALAAEIDTAIALRPGRDIVVTYSPLQRRHAIAALGATGIVGNLQRRHAATGLQLQPASGRLQRRNTTRQLTR